MNVGSPPQVRGKRFAAEGKKAGVRITPAGAGKTRGLRNCGYNLRDHPRRCGENATPHTRISAKIGSPPQVRGKRIGEILIQRKLRITPAGAGKTYHRSL